MTMQKPLAVDPIDPAGLRRAHNPVQTLVHVAALSSGCGFGRVYGADQTESTDVSVSLVTTTGLC
jgi:hypothetical protein